MTTTEPSSDRVGDVAAVLLSWLGPPRAPGTLVNPSKFVEVGHVVSGKAVTKIELTRALQRMLDYGLIKKKGTRQEPLLRVGLSGFGEECVSQYGGDIRKFEEARRGGPVSNNYDYSVTITQGPNSQAVAHAQDVVQNLSVTVDGDRLRDVGKAAQEVADLLPAHMRDEVREAGKEVVRAAEEPEDVERARSAGQRLLDLLTASSATFVIVRFVIDALSGALGG